MSIPRQSLFFWLALGWSIAIFIACSVPQNGVPSLSNSDKVQHAAVFLVFGVLWMWSGRKPGWVIGVGSGFGMLIEIWQGVMPLGRSFDWYDGLADAVGVLLGVGLVLLGRKFL
jgi:VanZ family protein